MLTAAAEAGCQIVDLEVESAEEAAPRQLDHLRARLREAGTALLVSFHDFTRTKNLEQAAQPHRGLPPGFHQGRLHGQNARRQPRRPQADRRPLALGPRRGHRHGRGGADQPRSRPTRRSGLHLCVLARRTVRRTAPGQVTARTLRDLYRVEQLDHATRIFGVAGNPITTRSRR